MQVRALISVFVLVVMTGGSAAVADDKLDAVEKEIIRKWKEVKSMTAKVTMDSEFKQGSMAMKSTMKSDVEYLRQEGKMLSRLEGETEMVQKMGETEQKLSMPMLAVCDGEVTYTLMERMGQKICVKAKAEAQSLAGEAMFKALRDQHNLTLADDQEINGEKCWVIHATPKTPGRPGEAAKVAYCIRQKDGATVQMLGYDADGNTIMTATFSDIKFNVKLDPQRFEFKVPEGVQVMDMTNMP